MGLICFNVGAGLKPARTKPISAIPTDTDSRSRKGGFETLPYNALSLKTCQVATGGRALRCRALHPAAQHPADLGDVLGKVLVALRRQKVKPQREPHEGLELLEGDICLQQSRFFAALVPGALELPHEIQGCALDAFPKKVFLLARKLVDLGQKPQQHVKRLLDYRQFVGSSVHGRY